jgi:citrate lyase subunit beta / citryl-CoA lyase
MRSLLIAPADEQRLAEALESGADAIIVDLAQAAPAERAGARDAAAQFLKEARGRAGGPMLMARANALYSGETDADLDVVMVGAPDAILLPGSLGASSVQQLSAKLAVREAQLGLADGATRIIAMADTAQSLFHMGSYRGSSARLMGVAWSAEALRADIGAETDRDRLGDYLGAYRLARELTLLAATSARVAAIDTAFPDIRDLKGLRAEALAALRDGFTAKIARDPAQVGIINDVFPSRSMRLAKGGPS